MNITTCKTFAKISFYLILFGFFLKFYFIEEIQDYLAGKTTFATSYEDKPQIQVPSILLCSSPNYKEGRNWYNLLNATKLNLTLWEIYENITYNLDKDFDLSNTGNTLLIGFPYGQKLKKGINHFTNYSIDLKAIATGPSGTGMCHLITVSVADDFEYKRYLAIGLKMLQPPRQNFKFLVYFLDDNSWQEIVFFNEFRYSSYSRIEVPIIKDELKSIDVSAVKTTEMIHLNGVENRSQCISDFLKKSKDKKSNCSQICAPLMFNFVAGLPLCANFEDFWCLIWHVSYVQERLIKECFNAKKTTKYNIDIATETHKSKITGLMFRFQYISPRVEVQEERYIIGGTDFIGSVGGSLGLFLGFSFFTYSSDLLEYIFQKLSKD